MRLIIVVVVVLLCNPWTDSKSTKKSKDTNTVLNKKLTGKSTKTQPAIIAIEIVDPNENSTTSKNSKRTIGASLGYGYQNYFGTQPQQPKYEVYKYSQHDIPAYHGINQQPLNTVQMAQYNIQPSISYKLQDRSNHIQQYYQPGTTLFSTINNQGNIGGLSTQLPQQYDSQVPVIILKVYPSQLADPSASLHPNLPQTHPLAQIVNSIDVQALLSKYVQNLLNQNYQQQQQQHTDDGLLTHENYPKDTHTRIVFRNHNNNKNQSPDMQGYYYNFPQNQETVAQMYYYQQQADNVQQQPQYYQQEQSDGQQYNYEQPQQYEYVSQDYGENAGYNQAPVQQQQYGYSQVYQQDNEEIKPHNYHAHPKRSQRAKNSRQHQYGAMPTIKDIKRLAPIK